MARPKKSAGRHARRRAAEQERLLAELVVHPRVVCDRCGLEQPYVTAGYGAGEFVATCQGWEGIGCGSETCHSIEGYEDSLAVVGASLGVVR